MSTSSSCVAQPPNVIKLLCGKQGAKKVMARGRSVVTPHYLSQTTTMMTHRLAGELGEGRWREPSKLGSLTPHPWFLQALLSRKVAQSADPSFWISIMIKISCLFNIESGLLAQLVRAWC